MTMFNGYLVSFALSLIPFALYHRRSFRLFNYFSCLGRVTPVRCFVFFVFAYLLLLIMMTFYDVLTITHDKLWLQTKEKVGLWFILLFEVPLMVISPLLYVHLRKEYEKDKEMSRFKAIGGYFLILTGVNVGNVLFGSYFSEGMNQDNYGFSDSVPKGLAVYSKIDQRLYQFIYFNFGLLMAIGKFIGFTYLPYGMSKFVSEFIFIQPHEPNAPSSDDEQLLSFNDESQPLTSSRSKPLKAKPPHSNSINERSFLSFSYGIVSFCLILFIIYTKISIIYVKLFYNICGVDCGLLAYRYDEIVSLETILSKAAQYSNDYIKWDYLAFVYLLFFRMLTLIHSMRLKGISFLWVIYAKPNRDMSSFQLLHLFSYVLFASFVLIYDFTYLLPDYMRFNGLDPICDYSLIQKSYCGVSFFGLLFIKVSMNYHLFMYWDIIASLVFITNSIIWAYRLIIVPGMDHFFNA